jgi:hypothetical protein
MEVEGGESDSDDDFTDEEGAEEEAALAFLCPGRRLWRCATFGVSL